MTGSTELGVLSDPRQQLLQGRQASTQWVSSTVWKERRMRGRGFRSGRFRRGSSFGARPRGVNRGRRRSSSRSSKHGTGRSSEGDVVVYSNYDSRGRRTYIGSTNNPDRRAAQHIRSGKLRKGGKLVVESKPMSRRSAEKLEARKIQGYRRRTGRLSKHNKTPDGRYRSRD